MKKVIVPIGPYHPLFEEPEYFALYCDGERVVDVEWIAGYNHRGIEKISESKHWDQITFLVERICGICSTSHPIAYCNAVEDLAKVEIPERAKYIRCIIGELERIHSHLLWVGLAGHFLGYNTVFMWAWKYREPILDIMEMITGNRNHYAMMKIGGVRRDIDDAYIPIIRKILEDLKPKLNMLTNAVLDDPVLAARLKGVGVLTNKDIKEFGALGPVARASGLDIDVRRDSPHSAYGLVEWKVITQNEGDVFARAVVRLLECFESMKIIEQCLDNLKGKKGEISIDVRNIPPGEGIGHYEAPRGECFHYVRSDGTGSPLRHKIRAPSFNNIPTFKASCIGETISDVTIILAGVDPCYCCTERAIVAYDVNTQKKILDGSDFIRLSQEKTRKIEKEIGVAPSRWEEKNWERDN
ncbi:MAG TPA: nickel-dependent hydrogenase large subunit [bacterium]|jgi:NADH-quinone oxidoreductase subunit D|nr:nickel-dependent hydrogenase large subunit [bacterium]